MSDTYVNIPKPTSSASIESYQHNRYKCHIQMSNINNYMINGVLCLYSFNPWT